MSNIPANGGHGRRIVEDYIERSSLSQVPVAKSFLRMPKKTPLRLGRKTKLPGGGTKQVVHGSSLKEFQAHQAAKKKVIRNRKIVGGTVAGTLALGAAYGQGHKDEVKGKYSLKGDDGVASKSLVDKSQRYYDPEHRRQRRFGVGMAATGLAGAGLAVAGGRGLRAANKVVPKVVAAAKPAAKKAAAKPPARAPRKAAPKYYKGTGRDLAMVGGGSTLMAGSAGLAYHGNHTRGKAWT